MSTDRQPLLAQNVRSYDGQKPASNKDDEAPMFNIDITVMDFVWIVTGLWSVTMLAALDGTIVATLLSDIGSSFEKSNMASWLGTSYLLSVCCFTPIYGRLCDIMGRRGAMFVALISFGVGTILCGIAPSMETLIAARALAGIGGGGLTSVGSIIVTDLVPLKRRGFYQGLANCFFGLGAGLGGPLGGWLSDNYGWRSAFLVQIPILFISGFLVWLKVHIPLKHTEESAWIKLRRIDWLGSATLVVTVSALLLSLTLKTSADVELPWSDARVWGLLVVSLVFGIAFVCVEKYVSKEAIMPMRLVTRRTPAFVAASNFLVSVLAFSVIYNVPLFFTAIKQTSSSIAGSHLVPNSVALALGSVAAGAYMRHTGRYWWLTTFMAALTLASCAAIATFKEQTPEWLLWTAIAPHGFGVSGVITSTLIALIASVDHADVAVATGISYMFRTTGQVLGVSLSAALTQSLLTQKLSETITGPGSAEIISRIRHSTSSIAHLPPHLKSAAIDAYSSALRVVFVCQVVLAAMTLLAVCGMADVPLSDKRMGPAESAGEEDEERRSLLEGEENERQ